MDAQNAVESANTKQAASPKRGFAESEDPKPTVTASNATTNNIKPPLTAKASSTSKELRPVTALPSAQDDDVGPDQNSDAETIVLPGKDGVSPSKPRKVIKHEDRSDGEIDDVLPPPRKYLKDGKNGERNGGPSDDAALLERKKRLPGKEKQPRSKDVSSGLSSAPASPPPHRRNNHEPIHRRRRSSDAHSESGSESSKTKSSKDPIKQKSKSVDRLLPGKRKAPKAESDDEGDSRKIRRPRISETGLDNQAVAREKDQKSTAARLPHDRQSTSRNRSLSPHGRSHRRSLSTQLPSQSSNGFSTKKRRIPAPLQSTDYHSDDSSASGSPHPRSSKLRSIATPVTGESTISPARMPAHKKHVDNHGQTLLAKACAKGEYEAAKRRLTERPEDLNFADYAGNTPLQVASLNGHEQIVQLLIDAGCNLDCRNSDKETPLLDAVENGHLGVVKLLLKAGVNPRKADAEGHEPLEKVPDELENAEEIRAALREAKERVGELRRTSEDHQPHDMPDTLSSHGPESPRRSPAAQGSSLASQRRGGAVRSTKTSNHLLYMNLDDKTLRQAAARGDNETVTRVLQVKERCDDPEALVNAARGGHSFVVELLLALGGANPDPPRPVPGLPTEHGTPMLAAIGGENIEVIKLLLNASNFDPTRRYKGQTYYEIARRREGPMWKEEEHLLKNAYDEFKKTPKASSKTKSPGRRDRELDPESRRANRESNVDTTRSHKRRPSSPSRDVDPKKKSTSTKASGSPKEKTHSVSSGNHDEQTSPKRGPGRPKKEERVSSIATSDREVSPAMSKTHPPKSKLVDSDPAINSSDTETTKPRRKLISGKELKGHREKQRRASLASNNSTVERGDTKTEDPPEKRPDRLSEKYHDRTKAIKRDESNDRLSLGESPAKRPRSSVTPPRHGLGDKDDTDAPTKRRRLDPDNKERRPFQNSSPESRQQKRDPSRDPARLQRPSDDRREVPKAKKTNRDRRESEKASPLEKASITVASEDVDVDMRDAPQIHQGEESETQADRERKEAKRKQVEADAIAAEEAKKKETEQKRQEAEKKKQEAEARRREEVEKKRLQDEERSRVEKEERKRKEEEEKTRLEEERKEKEEQERKLREEEERTRKEEEERKKREEEARIRREREAAEEAQRLREEEERKERERKRAAERAAHEAEMQRAREEEMEKVRLSKLPPLLRWLDACPDPKQKDIAELFAIARGVRYDTINPSATGHANGREQWLLNTQVALLLGEKDTSLSRCEYSLTEGKLYHLGEQLPDFYGGDPWTVGYRKLEQIRGEAWKCFSETEMFFIKQSDFLYIVPSIPHLRNVKLSIWYCELPEHESALSTWSCPGKWKQDPDAESRGGFAPQSKYYINGELVGERKPQTYQPSKTPFPEHRVPRREGLVAVTPNEPDYARICIEQGLTHLLSDQQKQAVLNGAHLTPRSMVSNEPLDYVGDNLSPSTESPSTTLVNGIKSGQEFPGKLPVNGTGEHDLSGHRRAS
ncbi:hypothetical protein Daesc_008399 [Daldinia eschscholtzii]|uniref:Uncharacterized protein n=1 Tax=Daldinia eschscholtzii TaxID=292717 RepID=A0AAX6MBP4_9PEZI